MDCPEYHHSKNPCHNTNHVQFPYLIELAVFDREEDIEEIEDCVTTTQTERQWQTGDYDSFHRENFSKGEDEEIYAVRLKVIIRRIE